VEIFLGENEYSLDRIGLRLWLALEEIRETINKAAENRDTDNMALSINSYISAALGISSDIDMQLPWYEVATAYMQITTMCIPKHDLAILRPKKEKDERKVSWDYPERTFYLWSHIIASHYSWTLDYIADMPFDDALAILQEAMVEEQLQKEWQWSLSEIAYPYNETTKRSKFQPFPRPSWMSEEIIFKPIKKIKIPRVMMPMGNVIRMEMPDETPIN
jgi:hypothetical protein